MENTNLELFLNIKPLSDNKLKMPCRNRLISTKEARQYQKDLSFLIKAQRSYIKPFQDAFAPTMIVSATYVFVAPEAKYWKQDGNVSIAAGDMSNYVKSLQDIVCKEIGIDDKYIKDTKIISIPGKDWSIYLKYKLHTQEYISALQLVYL